MEKTIPGTLSASSSSPYFQEAWAIITAAGCVDRANLEVQAHRLAKIIDVLRLERRHDEEELAWLAADRFVTDQLRLPDSSMQQSHWR